MKKGKLVFWLLILGAIAVVVFQNEGYFMDTQQSLRLNLKAFPEYQSPQLPLVVFHLLFFGFGLIVAYLFGGLNRWRRRKAVTHLTAENAAQRAEIESLKAELAGLKGAPDAGAQQTSVTSPVVKN
jgi:hypothetical protein